MRPLHKKLKYGVQKVFPSVTMKTSQSRLKQVNHMKHPSPPILIPEPSPLPKDAHKDLTNIYKEVGSLISAAIIRSIKENREKTL